MATTSIPAFAKWSDHEHSGPIIIVTMLSLLYWLAPGISQQVFHYGQSEKLNVGDYMHLSSIASNAHMANRKVAANAA
jgi:hypothetical protein